MKIVKHILAVMLVAGTLAACRPEIPEFQYLETKSIENMAGQWKGLTVVQRDNDAERKKFPYQSMDITSFVQFSNFKLNLNATGGNPSTFTIDNGASLPLFRFTTGNWYVNNPKQVTEIVLKNGNDSAVLNLSPLSNLRENKATFNYTKKLAGKPVITYELTLTK